MLAASAYPALHLNADFSPLTVLPLSRVPWQDAVRAVLSGAAVTVAEYDREVCSPSFRMRLPSVIAIKEYIDLDRHPAPLTRQNLFLRDEYRCQYCGEQFPTEELTFDHVDPRSKGGGTSYLNIVAACGNCNLRKGNKSLKISGMKLRREPYAPTRGQLNRLAMKQPVKIAHHTWRDVIYWDSELEV